MRQLLSKSAIALAGLALVGGFVVCANPADAKRIKIGIGSGPAAAAAIARSGGADANPAPAVDAKTEEAERIATLDRAKEKLAAERVQLETAGAQVNSSATVNDVTCIAGCYK